MHGARRGPASLLVARQPILDRAGQVVAYELLARRTLTDAAWTGRTEDSRTTSRVIRQAFLEMDVWSLTEGLPAYINFTRALLLDGVAETLPPQLAVIELVETITPDAAVEAACRRLRAGGYRIALDDVVAGDPRLSLLGVVDVVKLDFAASTDAARRLLVEQCHAAGVQTLAEKVETPEQHDEAARLGCDLFQGYFFYRPAVVGARRRRTSRLAHLQLLRSAIADDLDRDAIGDVLARDRGAVRRFHALAAATGASSERESTVRAALDGMDDRQLTVVVAALAVLRLSQHEHHPLRDATLLRARFCEHVVPQLRGGHDLRPRDGYVAGLCSLLDGLLGEPLAAILERLQVQSRFAAACTGGAGTLGTVLALVGAYEHGRWHAVARHAARLGVATDRLGPLYLDCIDWVQGLPGRRAGPRSPA